MTPSPRSMALTGRKNNCQDLNLSGFPGGSDSKEYACHVGDLGSIPGSGRCPGEGNGNPLQYLAWRIPMTEETGGWRHKRHNTS